MELALRRFAASANMRVAALVFCVFSLTSTGWLLWVNRLAGMTPSVNVDLIALVWSYVAQAVGTAAYVALSQSRPKLVSPRTCAALTFAFVACLIPALQGELMQVISIGLLANLLCGVLQGHYLAALASQVGPERRGTVFGGAYAASTLASWCLAALPLGAEIRTYASMALCLTLAVISAVLMAKDVIDEPFIIINGDDYYGKDSFKVAADWCRAHENTKGQYAIIGFELDKTLSESGSVSRGICHYDAEGRLTKVEEHLNIAKEADGVVYGDNSVSGENHIVLDGKALCSMNMWGFTPDYFAKSEAIFHDFLKANISELKKEYYIPYAIDCMIKDGSASCEVLSTPSSWFGVTYKEDRPGVVAKFAELVAAGVYPSPLY